MKDDRPNTPVILDSLKDFQRSTVEYVFQRLYVDEDCTRRFLVADEVGLGKTLVARGVIAKAIDHLWGRTSASTFSMSAQTRTSHAKTLTD